MYRFLGGKFFAAVVMWSIKNDGILFFCYGFQWSLRFNNLSCWRERDEDRKAQCPEIKTSLSLSKVPFVPIIYYELGTNLNQMLKPETQKPTRLNSTYFNCCGMRNEWMNHKLTTHYKRRAVEISWKSLWFYIIKPINKPFDALLRMRSSTRSCKTSIHCVANLLLPLLKIHHFK